MPLFQVCDLKRNHLLPETRLINTTTSSHFLHVPDPLELFVTSLVLMVMEHQTAPSCSVFHSKGSCSALHGLIRPAVLCEVCGKRNDTEDRYLQLSSNHLFRAFILEIWPPTIFWSTRRAVPPLTNSQETLSEEDIIIQSNHVTKWRVKSVLAMRIFHNSVFLKSHLQSGQMSRVCFRHKH